MFLRMLLLRPWALGLLAGFSVGYAAGQARPAFEPVRVIYGTSPWPLLIPDTVKEREGLKKGKGAE